MFSSLLLALIPAALAAPTQVQPRAIWQPAVGTTFQITLLNPLAPLASGAAPTPDVQVFETDLFDTPATTIAQYKAAGKKIICYFSGGSAEDWRPDFPSFLAADKGNTLDGWAGETWLNTASANVRSIMQARIALAVTKGCDAIDPDNVDGFTRENGVGLTRAGGIEYIKFLSSEAAAVGLSYALKNGGDFLADVQDVVHMSIIEQCQVYDECATYSPMIAAGKPVFAIEYPSGIPSVSAAKVTTFCKSQVELGFSTILKKLNLDGWVQTCGGVIGTTKIVS